MVCVYCGGQTEVVNSRPQQKNNAVWRRRHCKQCGAVFSTQESVQYGQTWRVQTGKRFQPFSRTKLFMSLYKSCEHRKTAVEDAQGLTDTVIAKLPALMRDGIITNKDITGVVQVALHRFDAAASSHYQAYHPK